MEQSFCGKPEWNKPLGKPTNIWDDDIEECVIKANGKVNWIKQAQCK
jgi:hypothetical protein